MDTNCVSTLKRSVDEAIGYNQNKQDTESVSVKKLRKSKVQISESNSVINLNENIPGITYNVVEQTGPPHNTKFKISIQIDDRTFIATGRSKKQAKALAAIDALKYLVEVKKNTCAYVFADGVSKSDFVPNPISAKPPDKKIVQKKKLNSTPSQITTKNLPSYLAQEKNPISLINELYKNPEFIVEVEDVKKTGNLIVYKAALKVDDQSFEGRGFSKQTAKLAACKEALARIYRMSFTPVHMKAWSGLELDQNHANKIELMIYNKYSELVEGYQESLVAKKVLAGIVMTQNLDFDTAKVIAVTTGTKVVGGNNLCLEGTVLNDMHAEILARRCMMKFLYSELNKYLIKELQPESIFELTANDGSDFRVKVREGIEFHLYISTAPCGDAAVFSPRESCTVQEDVKENRKTHGLLRTKIESGEGTIPVKTTIQTWDGILLGNRVLTMSCSDKVCRWNVVGIQGSLLSSIIDPIYFYSIVLGNLFHPVHTYRGICGRIESEIQNLPPMYRMNKPYLAVTTSSDRRLVSKSPNYSSNWTTGDAELEIINCATGRTIKDHTSDLAKIKFFKRYQSFLKKIPQKYMTQKMIVDRIVNYGEAKSAAKNFQLAKQELFKAFQSKSLGNWLKKPMEQDEFYINSEKDSHRKTNFSEQTPDAIYEKQNQKKDKQNYSQNVVKYRTHYLKGSSETKKKTNHIHYEAYSNSNIQTEKDHTADTSKYNTFAYPSTVEQSYYSNSSHTYVPPSYYENSANYSQYTSTSYVYGPASSASHQQSFYYPTQSDGGYYK